MKPVKVGLLGLGTVGGGTAVVLQRNAEEITRRVGCDIVVDHIATLDLDRVDELGLDKNVRATQQASDVVSDPEIDIVVELIGGYSPAKELVLQAIENGKHVVTANKALIAMHGDEIFAKAEQKGVTVAFEAAVAGGIPIIKALREGLSANRVEWLAGIINGTGNFILTEMRDKGRAFADVLAEAQALGYAEADPTFDVEGIDAAHKLSILSSLAYGIPLQFAKTYTEGISNITPEDVEYAAELGYRIKHLGIARRTHQGIEQRVHPTLIPEQRLIANVDGVMNAVLVQSDAVGPTFYYGAGAGDEPTASAVIADIVDVARSLTTQVDNSIPHLAFHTETLAMDLPILNMDEVQTAFYLRLRVQDRAGVLAEITTILAASEISIEAMLQKNPENNQVSVIMLTQIVREGNMNTAIAALEQLDAVYGTVSRIRVESLS